MLRPQKGNSGVSFNDTLLNFGLSSPYDEIVESNVCTTVSPLYILLYIWIRICKTLINRAHAFCFDPASRFFNNPATFIILSFYQGSAPIYLSIYLSIYLVTCYKLKIFLFLLKSTCTPVSRIHQRLIQSGFSHVFVVILNQQKQYCGNIYLSIYLIIQLEIRILQSAPSVNGNIYFY